MVTMYEPEIQNHGGVRTELLLSKGETSIDLREHLDEKFIFSHDGARGLGSSGYNVSFHNGKTENVVIGSILNESAITLPLFIYGSDHNKIQDQIDKLDTILNADTGAARLNYGMKYCPGRYVDVFQIGAFDWSWGVDTNANTYAFANLSLKAVQKYWTYEVTETAWASGTGTNYNIIRPFSTTQLLIGSSAIGGKLDVENYGVLDTEFTIRIQAPCSRFRIGDEAGRVLRWESSQLGYAPEAGYIVIDTKAETIRLELSDDNAENLFGGVVVGSKFPKLIAGWHELDFMASSPYWTPRAEIKYQARYRSAF